MRAREHYGRASPAHVEGLRLIAEGRAASGEAREALDYLARIADLVPEVQTRIIRTAILSVLATALASLGDFDAALDTARAIKDATSRASTLAAVAAGMIRDGQADSGATTFAEALNSPLVIETPNGRVRSIQNRVLALQRIAEAQHEAGNPNEAEQTFLTAIEAARGLKSASSPAERSSIPSYLIGIAQAQARSGMTAASIETFDEAEADSDALADPNLPLRVAIARAQVGDFSGAHRVATGMPDTRLRAQALGSIAEQQAMSKQIEAADQTLAEATTLAGAQSLPSVDRALRAMMVVQAEAGDVAGAIRRANELTDAAERAIAISSIAAALAGG